MHQLAALVLMMILPAEALSAAVLPVALLPTTAVPPLKTIMARTLMQNIRKAMTMTMMNIMQSTRKVMTMMKMKKNMKPNTRIKENTKAVFRNTLIHDLSLTARLTGS